MSLIPFGMLEERWTIDVSNPLLIEQQVIALVEAMDEQGVFDRQLAAENDN